MKSLVGDMTTVSDEVSAVLSANEVIVDGISTLSGITQEISASTSASRTDMDGLHDSVSNVFNSWRSYIRSIGESEGDCSN